MQTTPQSIRIRRDESRLGERLGVGIGMLAFKVTTADSHGTLLVVELAHHARGGPARHLHHGEDEWFTSPRASTWSRSDPTVSGCTRATAPSVRAGCHVPGPSSATGAGESSFPSRLLVGGRRSFAPWARSMRWRRRTRHFGRLWRWTDRRQRGRGWRCWRYHDSGGDP
jgi:hypothetical protein